MVLFGWWFLEFPKNWWSWLLLIGESAVLPARRVSSLVGALSSDRHHCLSSFRGFQDEEHTQRLRSLLLVVAVSDTLCMEPVSFDNRSSQDIATI